ncbi:MAG: phosphoenolpyruvate synthase [Proteobacteria bacterium]|nr:phosphoenolpyruvate synthase [Pseudomonadota bacterium]MBU1716924.1 phosphoenolpyruvate synthase [Pseudomonadota bacterium]
MEVKSTIESDALKANLLETAVEEVTIDPSFAVLQEVVADFKGISTNIENLLYEISHPFRNWNIILPKLRVFVLKNSGHYLRHQKGPEAFDRFCTIFFTVVEESRRNETRMSLAMESLLAYVEKTIVSLDSKGLQNYESGLNRCFGRIYDLDNQVIMHIVQGHHPVKKIATMLVNHEGATLGSSYDFHGIAKLMSKILALNYRYWLREEDPLPWFTAECGDLCVGWQAGKLFNAISHQQLRIHLDTLNSIDLKNGRQALEQLLGLPAHIDVVRLYKEVPEQLVELKTGPASDAGDRFAENRRLLFLFRIMDTAGLGLIHEETLREINRGLVQLIRQQVFEEIESFLLTTFKLLKANIRKYPHTSLQCMQVLGTEVFKRNNSRLVETFLWETVRFGFHYANVTGVDEDWQPITNPAHLANIRVWLNLIMQEPKWCATMFSALIINLKLSGTCVKDTDLFQRDISRLLNHPIEPVYNLVKQFAKLMPVFFNEIGAEGVLRDVSTEVDEIHKRRDLLIHFLRKQSHVESSNLIVDFIRAIFEFWRTKDKEVLTPFLPEEVFRQVKTKGPFIDDLHILMQRVSILPDLDKVDGLVNWDDHRLSVFLAQQTDLAAGERLRFRLLVKMFKLLYQKYNLGFQEMRLQLQQAVNAGFPEVEQLLADLEICDTFHCLDSLLRQLEKLKEIILSPEVFEAKEDIYYKRHIAVDIPSVYGRYREKKFDALGLTFRLENLANLYLEKLPLSVNLSIITRATFIRIIKCIRQYLRALKIDGITSRRLDTYLSLLSNSLGIKRFSYTQYLDIFRGLSEGVKDVIYVYYTNIHENNLSIIVPQIGAAPPLGQIGDNLLVKYRSLWSSDDVTGSVHRLSEAFLRNLIADTFGLQHLDNFITRIYQTLENQKDVLDEETLDLLMTYNPDRVISFIHRHNTRANNMILLGNKGYNLTLLASDQKPVPPGFIITTEIFRCWSAITGFDRAREEFMTQIRNALTEIEQNTGRRFGDPDKPLLLSVRSGASISMPGMMATIHNIGLNEEIVEAFAKETGKEYLAWDNYRRFLQSWAMTEGVDRETFQGLMNAAKARHGVQVKRDFTPAQMKELALDYQKNIRNVGIGVPDDPWLQLTGAVEMVLNSWNTVKTKEYRALMDVSEAWGTAVIVQTMVFGNLGPESGSGVLFTAHPYRKVSRVALWGDYAPADQGEDIVSGLVATYPVSVEQAELDGRSQDNSLELRFPKIYERLLAISRELVYEKRWNPQEIEFTFEGPEEDKLYILQTRDMITIKKKESFFAFKKTKTLDKFILGKGIGVSGSALSGRAVFSAANIEQLRREDPDAQLILIRQDTVPEDIKEISMVDGLLTARGGQTSHASVVTLRLEKTCVVGCNALKVYETEERAEAGNYEIRFGDEISIDGRKGLFLKGTHPVKKEVHILPI